MPILPDTNGQGRDFQTYAVPQVEPQDPTLPETVSSAFRLHNDVANVAALLSAPAFPVDPNFRVGEALRNYDAQNRTNFYDNNRNRFLGVGSNDEMLHGIGKITQENADQDTLARAGWTGTVAAVSAGLASPTMIIPFIGEERGAAAVLRGAVAGAGASAASETALYENQMTRTTGDVAFGVAAGTVMGGILGGAASFLHPGEAEVLTKELHEAAHPPLTGESTLGAARADLYGSPDAGGLASGAKTLAKVNDATYLFTNPVTQNINQEDSIAFRRLTQQLSDSGVAMGGNADFIPASPGGTIENNLNQYTGQLSTAQDRFDDIFNDYFFDGKVPAFAPNIQASLKGTFNAGGKLTRDQFAQEVTRANWAGDVHDIPEVQAAAQAMRKNIYDPIFDAAKKVGIYGEDTKVVGDEGYATRLYDNDAIKTYPQEFMKALTDHNKGDLQARFQEAVSKFQTKQSQSKQLAEDLVRPADEVEQMKQDFLAKLQEHEENLLEETSQAEAAIANNRATARVMKQNQGTAANEGTRQQLLKDARDMEKATPGLAEAKGFRAETRRRLRNLSQSVAALTGKQARKLDIAEGLEDKSHDALYRVVRKANATLRNLDKWTDKKLDEELSSLKNTFETSANIYDRGEERVAKLIQDEPNLRSQTTEQPTVATEQKEGETVLSTAEGKSSLSVTETPEAIKANVAFTAKEARGKGHATALYEKALDLAREKGLPLRSDEQVSIDAAKVYARLEEKGYKVTRNPEAVKREDGLWEAPKLDEGSNWVYQVDPGPPRPSPNIHKLGALEDLQQARAEKLTSISEKIEHAQTLAKEGNRDTARAFIKQSLDETIDRISELNARKNARAARLREQAAAIDPQAVATRATQIVSDLPKNLADFERSWETKMAADSVDATKGTADFSTIARENAEKVKDAILGTYARLPYSDIMQQERGAELARVLHIPSKAIDKFLEKDSRKLAKSYVHTLGPDIEIMKKFGTLNMGEILQPAVDELNQRLAAIGVAPQGAEKMSKEELAKAVAKGGKESKKLNDNFNLYKTNFTALVDRLRGTRGLPSDPDGYVYRAGRTIMQLNVLRDMGMVTAASLPDVARPIMRYGLLRTFRDGFIPLITNLKGFQAAVGKEAKLAGVATESSAHMRALSLKGVLDDAGRGSKFEKGVEWATQHMGVVALFEPWTRGMEMLSSSIASAKIMDALAVVNTGSGQMSKKLAQDFLAQNGFNGELAERAWQDISANGGGQKVNGIWMPNTESWKDAGAQSAFRSALAREVYNTIQRPGLEKPLLADGSMTGKMLYQFKSFGMSSMPKMMMSGLQQRDAAALSGTLASLGMGAVSYWAYAHMAGGKALDDMRNGDAAHWADAAIQRSGLVAGFIGEGQNLANKIPLLQDFSSFSGGRGTRRPGDNVMQTLLGPSFDFGQNVAGVITSLAHPTQQTLNQARRLTPFQNTMGIREGIDAVQNAIGKHLPERN